MFYIYIPKIITFIKLFSLTFASLTSACSVSVCLSKQNPQITAKTIQEPDSRSSTPTTSNRQHFFSSNPTHQHRSLVSSLPIHPQIGNALISNPTQQRFNSSRMILWRFFSTILNRQNHPQSSGSLFTYD